MFKARLVAKFKNILCNIHTSCALLVDHYGVLGVNPRSTQSEIKAAYYKLSKQYHPDINHSVEAEIKFRSITEAYEVLGNLRLKKLYDKGVIQHFDPDIVKEHETPEEKFQKSRNVRHKVPAYGKTTIYDFDEWTRAHYSEKFNEKQFDMRRNREMREGYQMPSRDLSNTTFVLILFSLFTIYFIAFGPHSHIDHVPTEKIDKKDK